MSYNKTKVSSKSPNSSSEITLNLGDVTSVATPLVNQVLAYNGANWINENASWISEFKRSSNSLSYSANFKGNYNYVLSHSNIPNSFSRAHYWHKNINNSIYTDHQTSADNDAELEWYQDTASTKLYYAVKINFII